MFEELLKEGVLLEGWANYVKSRGNFIEDKIFLTPNRIVMLSKTKSGKLPIGGLAGLTAKAIESYKKNYVVPYINIDLTDLKKVERGRIFINKNVLILTDQTGETFKIGVKSYDAWEKALSKHSVS